MKEIRNELDKEIYHKLNKIFLLTITNKMCWFLKIKLDEEIYFVLKEELWNHLYIGLRQSIREVKIILHGKD